MCGAETSRVLLRRCSGGFLSRGGLGGRWERGVELRTFGRGWGWSVGFG